MKLASIFAAMLATSSLFGAVAHADPTTDADASYADGRRWYDLREWQKAIAAFKHAYELRPEARSLFNIAQSYRLAGDCAAARGYYQTYRRNFPDAKNLALVDDFIVKLEPCAKAADAATAAQAQPAPSPAPPAASGMPAPPLQLQPEPTDAGPSHTALGVGLVAGGGAVLATGAIFAYLAHHESSLAASGGGTWNPDYQTAGKRDALLGDALLGAGAAAAIAGAIVLVVDHRRHAPLERVSIAPAAGGATVGWSCAF